LPKGVGSFQPVPSNSSSASKHREGPFSKGGIFTKDQASIFSIAYTDGPGVVQGDAVRSQSTSAPLPNPIMLLLHCVSGAIFEIARHDYPDPTVRTPPACQIQQSKQIQLS
jgi:hypothetical protein